MSSMLPLSTWQYGVSWPTIAAVADQAVYLLWKCLYVCLWVCMLVTCYLRFVPTILRESCSAECWMFAISCRVSLFVPSISQSSALPIFIVCCLTSKRFPSHPSLIHYNHLHQPFAVTAVTLRHSIKRTLCNKQMCNCPSVLRVRMKCTILYADSPILSTTILCPKACKLIINICPVNMKGLEQLSLLSDQRLAFWI